jgi:hypothetical protein
MKKATSWRRKRYSGFEIRTFDMDASCRNPKKNSPTLWIGVGP